MAQFAARTHAGRRGGENEDAIGWDVADRLWFVADGMGGHAAGHVASRIVKETLLAHAQDAHLDQAVLKAHEAVLAAAATRDEYNGMGSTVVSARINDGTCTVVWVGNSRAYLLRRRKLRSLTRDHSFIELLREEQGLSETELHAHPKRHLVTQSLGKGEPVPSLIETALRRGDRLLLCSDGLNDELTDQEIAAALSANPRPDAAADALIAAALEKGGRDNVSVVVLEYDGPPGRTGSRELSGPVLVLISVLGGVIAAAAVVCAWRYFNG